MQLRNMLNMTILRQYPIPGNIKIYLCKRKNKIQLIENLVDLTNTQTDPLDTVVLGQPTALLQAHAVASGTTPTPMSIPIQSTTRRDGLENATITQFKPGCVWLAAARTTAPPKTLWTAASFQNIAADVNELDYSNIFKQIFDVQSAAE